MKRGDQLALLNRAPPRAPRTVASSWRDRGHVSPFVKVKELAPYFPDGSGTPSTDTKKKSSDHSNA